MMKTKIQSFLVLLFLSMSGFSKTWVITNSGTSFSPATITINQGDSVRFELSASHNAREVSEATWNANGSTALLGGFETAYGGGLVLPSQLNVGTHWYVCVPHASIGMKAKIVVNGPTSIAERQFQPNVALYPNPCTSQTIVRFSVPLKNASIALYNSCGQQVKQVQSVSGQSFTLFRDNLPEGLYYLRLMLDGKIVATKKLIVVDKK
ncbi:MAG: T9SS type A sorting domain-containing protein [Bacteroidales bacterium]